jgi:hypothetical protein
MALIVGFTESQFWELQPLSLNERAQVVFRQERRREEQEWERAAWMVHHIMAAFVGGKNAPSVDRLLGRVTDA